MKPESEDCTVFLKMPGKDIPLPALNLMKRFTRAINII